MGSVWGGITCTSQYSRLELPPKEKNTNTDVNVSIQKVALKIRAIKAQGTGRGLYCIMHDKTSRFG